MGLFTLMCSCSCFAAGVGSPVFFLFFWIFLESNTLVLFWPITTPLLERHMRGGVSRSVEQIEVDRSPRSVAGTLTLSHSREGSATAFSALFSPPRRCAGGSPCRRFSSWLVLVGPGALKGGVGAPRVCLPKPSRMRLLRLCIAHLPHTHPHATVPRMLVSHSRHPIVLLSPPPARANGSKCRSPQPSVRQ